MSSRSIAPQPIVLDGVQDMNGSPPVGILDQLNKASSAEDFFALLGVAYDPKVVNVARLHILRRMAQYLASEDFDGAPDADVAARCKAVLERAYADFVTSSPIDQRVFKVLKDAVAPNKPPNLVTLGTLK
jgi:nitrogenase-stabilizing/protective protein